MRWLSDNRPEITLFERARFPVVRTDLVRRDARTKKLAMMGVKEVATTRRCRPSADLSCTASSMLSTRGIVLLLCLAHNPCRHPITRRLISTGTILLEEGSTGLGLALLVLELQVRVLTLLLYNSVLT